MHGNIKEVNTHKYTETDNLKFLTIDGTFKDNLGNFGQTNSLVYMLTKNNIVEKLESYNEFLYIIILRHTILLPGQVKTWKVASVSGYILIRVMKLKT